MAVGVQTTCLKRTTEAIDWNTPGRAHLVGIGGSGMSALTRVLHQRGWSLSGSDVNLDRLADRLPQRTLLHAGHAAAHVPPELDAVVHSDAVASDNPELAEARSRGVATLTYFDVAGRLMEGRRGLAVAGTHGKSTTTAMAGAILADAGLDPTVLCGAAPLDQPDGGRAGRGTAVLVEACEYRANFLKLHPFHSVILGIEPDHFDCYPTLADAEEAFGRFAALVPPDGLLLARAECPATRRAAAGASCRVETFGLSTGCDWLARPTAVNRGCYEFDLVYRGEPLCAVRLLMPGRHNMLNALAAAALARHQGVEPAQMARSLGRFRGLRRRLECVGTRAGITRIDDFAHHPTELDAALGTVRQMYPHQRVFCVFQPHQASRTARLLDELAASLHNGLRSPTAARRPNRLWIADVYRAREGSPAAGEVTAGHLADRVRRRGLDVAVMHQMDQIARDVAARVEPGDVLLTVGAGDIRRILDQIDSLTRDRE